MEEFQNADINERADFLWQNGDNITTTKDHKFGYSLYFVNGYYVDVKINLETIGIKSIEAFKNGPQFDKYLDNLASD